MIVEPKIHVTGREFSGMLFRLESAGLQVVDRPVVAISRCVVAESSN